jgi:hypothetical protein
VELVHHTLGRRRADADGAGWISGLSEVEGARRPTSGGLRIGKPRDERRPGEPGDEELECERDGQYFHYLTKWMHALDRMALATGELRYLVWALELAQAAHRAFVYQPAGGGMKRMYWKMSVDLSRPAVSSMGYLDPLDGMVTISRLRASLRRRRAAAAPDLEAARGDMRAMCGGGAWTTGDPLGIGGLLSEAAQLAQLIAAAEEVDDGLLARLLADIERSLQYLARQNPLAQPPGSRLAFRELGLAIGLHGVPAMRVAIDSAPDRFGGRAAAQQALSRIASIARFTPLAGRIEQAWLAPAAQATAAWGDHEDINAVMLATCLVPEVYLLMEATR